MIIPIRLQPELAPDETEELTLKDLNITEAKLEEFVRRNIQILFPEGETLLIVGQQQKNKQRGRADLVAVDGLGNMVLIELKRDVEDILSRKEPFEFQAVRYAANYALIDTPEKLVQKMFASYVEKHRDEYGMQELTPSEIARRRLDDFLRENKVEVVFNRTQRIILIASSFDPQTLSACAWLAKNGIDIRCVRLSPIRYALQYFFEVEQIIPPPLLSQYFVEVAEPTANTKAPSLSRQPVSKPNLPRMQQLFEWNVIASGDRIYISGHESDEAEIVDQRLVQYRGQKMPYNDWGKKVTGWQALNIYEWTVHKPTGKTLDALRREKTDQLAKATDETPIETFAGGSPGLS